MTTKNLDELIKSLMQANDIVSITRTPCRFEENVTYIGFHTRNGFTCFAVWDMVNDRVLEWK
jgi:hypothetical protein